MNYLKLFDDVVDPTYGTKGSACFDIRAYLKRDRPASVFSSMGEDERQVYGDEITLDPWDRCLIPTGLIFEIPKNYSMKVYSRSGNAIKKGLCLANSVGIIDSDYNLELMVGVINATNSWISIKNGDRIAQCELVPAPQVELVLAKQLVNQHVTDRRGGFGSTGV
jgi:dUTP pyrophosphatase